MKCRIPKCDAETLETFCNAHEPLPALLVIHAQILQDTLRAARDPAPDSVVQTHQDLLFHLMEGVDGFLAAFKKEQLKRGAYAHTALLGEQPPRG